MGVGVVGAAAGAVAGSASIGSVFVLVYAGSFAWIAVALVQVSVRCARKNRTIELPLFAILSIGAAMVWFALTVLGLAGVWWRSADEQLSTSLVAADVQTLTVPLVAGLDRKSVG